MTMEMASLRLVQPEGEVDFSALGRLRRGMGDLYDFVQMTAGAHGCSAAMYQLLLAIKTTGRRGGMDIGMLAAALGVRHPSAAEMVRKTEAAGFLRSCADLDDRRRVLLELTAEGEAVLAGVAEDHLAELRRVRAGFIAALNALG
jgi:DNA-binding MarR family transcriptional regulator